MSLISYFDKSLDYLAQKREPVGRAMVIAGLLLACAALGMLATGDPRLIDVVLGIMILALVGVVGYKARRFEFGLLALIPVTAILNTLRLHAAGESYITAGLILTMILVGTWLVQRVAARSTTRLKPSSLNLPILLFVGINVISLGWSNLLRDPLVKIWDTFPLVQLAALAVNILLPLLALLVFNKVNESKWLGWLVGLLLAAGALILGAFLWKINAFQYYEYGYRGLFPTWVGVFAYGLILFHRRIPWGLKLLLLLLLAGWLYHAFFLNTPWLSGWLPIAFGCGIVTLLYSKRLTLVLFLVGGMIIAVNYAWFYDRIVVSNVQEGSNRRLGLWEQNLRLVSRHPLLGVGPAGYAPYYQTYHPEDARSTHNNYFDVLGQTGVLGFIAFIWIWVAAVRVGTRTRIALAGRGDFEEAYANAALAGLLAGLLAMMLGDWILPFAYNQGITGFENASYTWIFLGGLFSLHHMLKRRGEISA